MQQQPVFTPYTKSGKTKFILKGEFKTSFHLLLGLSDVFFHQVSPPKSCMHFSPPQHLT
jgi:hypothetical protein